MKDETDRLNEFIDRLLEERSPTDLRAESQDELATFQMAARLKALREGSATPRPEFLQELRTRLSAHKPRHPGLGRRQLIVSALGSLAAGILAGIGLDKLLSRPQASQEEWRTWKLVGQGGKWVQVATLDQLPPNSSMRFQAGPIQGYLLNRDGKIYALSAVCTHMGCLLEWEQEEGEFYCPCHGAIFRANGEMVPESYKLPLPNLWPIEVKVVEGKIMVWTV